MSQTQADQNEAHIWPSFAAKCHSIRLGMNEWCAIHMPGYTCRMAEGFRTAEYQNWLYQQGRTRKGAIITQKDGYNNESPHQSSLAEDLVPFNGKDFDWGDHPEFYAYLGHLARQEGLEWGGDWHSLIDIDHVQWKRGDIATYKAARTWQVAEGLRKG